MINQETTRLIDQYLSNEMSENDRIIFEERIKQEPELQVEIALQKDVIEGVKRLADRGKIERIKRQFHLNRFLKWGGISFISMAIIVTIGYFAVLKTDNKLGEEIQSINAPLHNVKGAPLSITIDPSFKQIVSFDNGTKVELPKDAFVDEKGNTINKKVALSLNTYNSTAEIIASGIPMTYHENGEKSEFVSAGMFNLSGKVGLDDVYIRKGENLVINYPTKVFGDDFDFFHFEEVKGDSLSKGSWKKLSNKGTEDISKELIIDTFKLQFASKDYPELAPLSTIDWKLGTTYANPKSMDNKWVLDKKWTSIEVSQPRYGLADKLIDAKIQYKFGYPAYKSLHITNDSSRIIICSATHLKIFSREGELIRTIEGIRETDYEPYKILGKKYLLVKRENDDAIYTLDGQQIGQLPKSHNHQLNNSKEVIAYRKAGQDYSVYISTISGKQIAEIELNKNSKASGLPWINKLFQNFLLTPKDQLIVTSSDRIAIYNLDGSKRKQKKGKFRSLKTSIVNKLLIEELDGTLTIWDYENDTEVRSKKMDFNLRNDKKENGIPYPDYFMLKDSPYVLINQSSMKRSLLWNYKTNSTSELPFYVPFKYYEWDKLPVNILEGYDLVNNTYHSYDVDKNEEILVVPNITYSRGDEIGTFVSISKDQNRVLVNGNKNPLYYNFNKGLIIEFKKFDSLIYTAGFIDNERVFTISSDGIYRTWDKNGVELSNKKLQGIPFDYAYGFRGKIESVNSVHNSRYFHNYEGELLINAGNSYNHHFLDDKILYINKSKKGALSPFFNLNPRLYQLNLYTKKEGFITYVYLNDLDLQKINQYNSVLIRRANDEKDRQQRETMMVRRFKINQFGLYNWDKLLKEENLLIIKASFDFGTPVEYSDMNVYLITDLDGKAVIRYSERTWENFRISPDLRNKLIAILPENKIAIFSQEDFEKIDFEKVKIDKTVKFKMQIIDQPITDLISLEKAIQ